MQNGLLLLKQTKKLRKILCYNYCTIFQFQHNYTPEDVSKILSEVNEKKFDELSRYSFFFAYNYILFILFFI